MPKNWRGNFKSKVFMVITLFMLGVSGQDFRFEIQPQDTTAVQGRPTQLDCRAIGSTGIYYIWVQEDSGAISSTRRRSVLPNGTLHFSLADRPADNGNFYCVAINDQNERIQSKIAALTVHYIENVFIEAEISNYRQGDKIEMDCNTPGASRVRYSWLRNNRTITADGRIVLAENKIIINQLLVADSGEYYCQVSNSYGRKNSNSFNLVVTGRPVIFRRPENAVIAKGKIGILDCVFKANEFTVLWYFNNTRIDRNNKTEIFSNNSLRISNFDSADEGEYTCIGQNAVGTAVAKATLRIAYIRPIRKSRILNIAWGTKAIITCEMPIALPKPTFKIYGDGLLRSTTNTYTIDKVSYRNNNVVYECLVSNIAGTVRSNTTVQVAEIAFPMFIIPPVDVLAKLGESALFNCDCGNSKATTWTVLNVAGQILHSNSDYEVLQNHSLYIPSVSEKHEGNYSCECSNFINQTSLTAQLKFPYIGYFHDQQTSLFSKIGHRAELICKLPDARPIAIANWHTSSGLIDSNDDHYIVNGNKLFITEVVISDNRTYTCKALNTAGERSHSYNLIVIVPPMFVVRPESITVDETDSFSLDCSATGNYMPEIKWLKNGNPIELNDRITMNLNGTLSITKALMSDSGMYNCIAENTGGTITAISYVTVKMRLRFLSNFNEIETLIFNPYERIKGINCSVISGRPFEVSWYRDGYPYQSNATNVQSDSILQLNQPSINESGIYICRANDSITSIQKLVNIKIAYVPYFTKHDQFATIRATIGDTVTLKVDIGGYPKPSLEWQFPYLSNYHNTTDDNVTSYEIYENGTLILRGIKFDDSGPYRCTAVNPYGSVSSSVIIEVVPKEPRQIGRGTIIIAAVCAVGYILIMIIGYFYCRTIKDKKTYDIDKVGQDIMQFENFPNEIVAGPEGDDECPYEEECEVIVGNRRLTIGDAALRLEFPKQSLKIFETMGHSKFGPVYKAWAAGITYQEKRTLVAIKQLSNSTEALRAEFMYQVNMMLRVGVHANIVKVLGVCLKEKPLSLIVEYTDKGDLKSYLLSCRREMEILPMEIPDHLNYDSKLRICQQICSGLVFMAARDFIHSDIAARNCVIDSSLNVKITNLSLSKDTYRNEYYAKNSSSNAIPLRWMAPEALFEQAFTIEGDVWSFGVLMWEVFSLGLLPYRELKHYQVTEGLRKGTLRLPIPGDSPVEIYGLMQQCWRNMPGSRPRFSELHKKLMEYSKLSRNDIIVYGTKCEGAVFCV